MSNPRPRVSDRLQECSSFLLAPKASRNLLSLGRELRKRERLLKCRLLANPPHFLYAAWAPPSPWAAGCPAADSVLNFAASRGQAPQHAVRCLAGVPGSSVQLQRATILSFHPPARRWHWYSDTRFPPCRHRRPLAECEAAGAQRRFCSSAPPLLPASPIARCAGKCAVGTGAAQVRRCLFAMTSRSATLLR